MQTHALAFVEDALTALERALHDRDDPLRNVVLATAPPDGAPSLRTLVLRGFSRAPATAEMHTDARAAKARDIARTGRASLLAWSPAARLQLRFSATARLHHDDALAHARWAALSANARDTYGLRATPGAEIADPSARTHLPPDEQARQFAVILLDCTTVDILRLGPGGQQTRAAARFTPDGIEAAWISP